MRRALALLALAVGLTACTRTGPVEPVPRPPERPARAEPQRAPDPPPFDVSSRELEAYYRDIERNFLIRGLLRQDGGGPDTPYDADRLARTFLELAFYEEYDSAHGVAVARRSESRLHRWERPVRIEPRFGASVDPARRTRDGNEIASFAGRLSRAAQHPISTVSANGNFVVYVVAEAERRALGPELRRLVPGLTDAALRSVLDLPRSSYCVVFAVDQGDTGRYVRAVALIRAEHPDLLRRSCFHEEIAQGLGLANDSPRARPSIFNDDEEFALLTTMDEHLLRILYDPRLRPGMTQDEARPIVHTIAREIVPGGV